MKQNFEQLQVLTENDEKAKLQLANKMQEVETLTTQRQTQQSRLVLLSADKDRIFGETEQQRTALTNELLPLDLKINNGAVTLTEQKNQIEQLSIQVNNESQQLTSQQEAIKAKQALSNKLQANVIEQPDLPLLQQNLPLLVHQVTEFVQHQSELVRLSSEQQALNASLLKQQENAKVEQDKQAKLKVTLQQTEQQYQDQQVHVNNLLAEHQLTDASELNQQLSHVFDEQSRFSQCIHLAEQLQQNTLKIDVNKKESDSLSVTFQESQSNLTKLKEKGVQLNQEVEDLQRLLKQDKIILSLAALQQQVKEDQACPLCGSLEHPALENYQPINSTDTEMRLREKEALLINARGEYSATKERCSTEKNHLAKLSQDHSGLIQVQQDLIRQWQVAGLTQYNEQSLVLLNAQLTESKNKQKQLAALQIDLQQQTDDLQQLQKKIQEKTQSFNAEQQKFNEFTQQLQSIEAEITANQHLLNQESAHIAQQKQRMTELLGEDKVTILFAQPELWLTEQKKRVREFESAKLQVEELNSELQQLEQNRALQAQTLHQIKTQLTALNEVKSNIEQSLTTDKHLRSSRYGELSSEDLFAQIKAQQTTAEQAVKLAQESDNALGNQQSKLEGEIKSIQAQLVDLQQQLSEQQASFNTKLSLSEFENTLTLQAAFLTEAEISVLQQTALSLKEALLSEKTKLDGLTEHQKRHVTEQKTTQSLIEIEEQLNQLKVTAEQTNALLLQDKNKLSHDDKNKEKQADIIEEQQSRKENAEYWQLLNTLIGQADGSKFRTFVQGVTLDNLVLLANQEMTKLHQRYQLKRNQHKDEILSLQVIDLWQANVVRDVKTLSGGESFLVSLGLALALSNLVSHKTQIESLFLDEGFGTLDENTLEVALEALERLNATGKLIGIISHVDALKERIDHQIHVNKGTSAGFSQLAAQYQFND